MQQPDVQYTPVQSQSNANTPDIPSQQPTQSKRRSAPVPFRTSTRRTKRTSPKNVAESPTTPPRQQKSWNNDLPAEPAKKKVTFAQFVKSIGPAPPTNTELEALQANGHAFRKTIGEKNDQVQDRRHAERAAIRADKDLVLQAGQASVNVFQTVLQFINTLTCILQC